MQMRDGVGFLTYMSQKAALPRSMFGMRYISLRKTCSTTRNCRRLYCKSLRWLIQSRSGLRVAGVVLEKRCAHACYLFTQLAHLPEPARLQVRPRVAVQADQEASHFHSNLTKLQYIFPFDHLSVNTKSNRSLARVPQS
jgi:hypothetical protein